MKKIAIIATLIVSTAVVFIGCKDKRDPGRAYMPDMAYSRGYETYAQRDTNFTMDPQKAGHKIFYNNLPPAGTMKRGEMFPYLLAFDSNNYKISGQVQNPIVGDLPGKELEEAGRLYNINCAICHGDKGAANGPLSAKIGAIANLTQPQYVAMADGTMFYSITYGLNNMGSYASQLSREQRWKVIKYIRTLQPKTGTTAIVATDSTTAK